jgi:hypothetical protein
LPNFSYVCESLLKHRVFRADHNKETHPCAPINRNFYLLTKILAASPPEQRELMQKQTPEQIKDMLSLMKTMTPSGTKITGGSIDGDQAWIHFIGKSGCTPLTGTATMARVSGQWRVTKMSTKE